MRLAALLLSLALPAAAEEPALKSLVPLLEVYDARKDTPGYDVGGIRCAGLTYSKESWRQKRGGQGPSRKALEESEWALKASVEHRIGLGQDRTRATISTDEDLRRVHDLYLARFRKNAANGHPWRDDPLLKGDQSYCDLILD